MLHHETEMLSVERHGTRDIFYLISSSVNALDKRTSFNCLSHERFDMQAMAQSAWI